MTLCSISLKQAILAKKRYIKDMFDPQRLVQLKQDDAIIFFYPLPELLPGLDYLGFGKRRQTEWYIGRNLLAYRACQLGANLKWDQVELLNYCELSQVPGRFSLSHTKGLCALAWSELPVGIDLERRDRQVPPSYETKFVGKEDRFDTQDSLLRWCVKEACFKALNPAPPKSLKEVVIKKSAFHYNGHNGSVAFAQPRELGQGIELDNYVIALALRNN